jgi:fused signal recognition particle receptor
MVFTVVGVVAIFGFIATVVYYFSRYFFVTHENDKETFKQNISLVKNDSAAIETAKADASTTVSLNASLKNTRENIWGRIKRSLSSGDSLGSIDRDILEEILYTSDMGPATVQILMEEVEQEVKNNNSGSAMDILRNVLKTKMARMFLATTEKQKNLWPTDDNIKPVVWMVVGVNGAGKTTTIGKLARFAVASGKKVLIVPGDTFRAAASDQLKVWAERVNAQFYDAGKTTDPSGVAYEAVSYAKTNGFDLVIVDTAGRLHTQAPLMEELKKIKRVISQVATGAPHHTLIVLDSNSGQNALAQAVAFHSSIGLTGVVITKLDGTAKGGVVLGVVNETHLPILFVGVGEKIEDLKEFNSQEFVNSIFS